MYVPCAHCNELYVPANPARQRYCTRRCCKAAERERLAVRSDDVDARLPPDTYVPMGELTDAYEAKCGMCGRAGEVVWLTRDQAVLRGRVGVGSCEVCGGWRTLELAFGASSSPSAAAPVRTVAQPTRPVPTRLGALP